MRGLQLFIQQIYTNNDLKRDQHKGSDNDNKRKCGNSNHIWKFKQGRRCKEIYCKRVSVTVLKEWGLLTKSQSSEECECYKKSQYCTAVYERKAGGWPLCKSIQCYHSSHSACHWEECKGIEIAQPV